MRTLEERREEFGMRRARGGAAWLLVAGVALVACAPAAEPTPSAAVTGEPAPSGFSPAPPTASVWRPAGDPVTVAGGLDAPWSVVPLPDGTLLVSQRDTGTIVEVGPGGATREMGTVPGVVAGGEAGLHGLAVSPDGAWLYAYHGAAADNRVVRMRLSDGAGSRRLGAPELVVADIPRAANHNGGRIAFGPDGFLYVTTGDAGVRDAAQDASSLAGKILRLTPDGDPAPGNPSGSAVYSLGHRNVQGLAWTADGALWASEFGQNTVDEVNRIQPGGNYGWPVHEGAAGDPRFVDPIVTWPTSQASPSGLAASGRSLFVAGLRGERVWMLDTEAGVAAGDPQPLWTGRYGRLRDAVVVDGVLWLLTNNTDGRGAPGPEDDRLLRVPLAPG